MIIIVSDYNDSTIIDIDDHKEFYSNDSCECKAILMWTIKFIMVNLNVKCMDY